MGYRSWHELVSSPRTIDGPYDDELTHHESEERRQFALNRLRLMGFQPALGMSLLEKVSPTGRDRKRAVPLTWTMYSETTWENDDPDDGHLIVETGGGLRSASGSRAILHSPQMMNPPLLRRR
jgi:hypothetical protein